MEQQPSEKVVSTSRVLISLLMLNVVVKGLFLNSNYAEYTDGILQLTLFARPNALWPPFYTILSLGAGGIVGSAELGAKLVSLISSCVLIVPLFFLARRIFNARAATFACLLYTFSPIAFRWSVRVMTDSLFALLFLVSFYFLFLALERTWGVERNTARERRLSALRGADAALAVAVVFSVLATLTRYTGVILLPVILVGSLVVAARHNRLPLISSLCYVLWTLVALWIGAKGFGHPAQFAERSGESFFSTYWNVFESFIAYIPYFITYPIAFCFLLGLFLSSHESSSRRKLLIAFSYFALVILVLQSAFSSFQSRYLLPLVPFIALYGGAGVVELEGRMRRARWLPMLILAIALLYGYAFSLAVMVLQRDVFRDVKNAALFAKDAPLDVPIYSNESYTQGLNCAKMQFWSGRNVQYFQGQPLTPGSILCLHSAYGGMQNFLMLQRELKRRYSLKRLAVFEASVVPLLPEVMEEPISHQNPLAWVMRYERQYFYTIVYEIAGSK